MSSSAISCLTLNHFFNKQKWHLETLNACHNMILDIKSNGIKWWFYQYLDLYCTLSNIVQTIHQWEDYLFRWCINLNFKNNDSYDWLCAPGSHIRMWIWIELGSWIGRTRRGIQRNSTQVMHSGKWSALAPVNFGVSVQIKWISLQFSSERINNLRLFRWNILVL